MSMARRIVLEGKQYEIEERRITPLETAGLTQRPLPLKVTARKEEHAHAQAR